MLTSLQQHKWNLPHSVPAKPAGWDYGYVLKGQAIGRTREQLIELVQRGAEMSYVWTPDTPEPVLPESVPFLIDAFRRNIRREARNTILFGAGLVVFDVLTAIVLHEWSLVYRSFLFVLGAVFLIDGIWVYAGSRHYTQEDAMSDAATARFAAWIKNKPLSGYSFTLAACIVVVFVIQSFLENSIEVAGLVKPAVWNGEIWRLFTATVMHANFMHFWMNLLALVSLSKIVEQTVQRAYVPLIFLLTAVVGSVFSVLLYPNSTSVGASGGLMGLFGFITITAYFDRTRYPPKYLRRMIEVIVLTGALGVVGFAFIDNAAHFGGLVAGLLLGWFFVKRSENGKLVTLGGSAALIALASITAFAVYRMLLTATHR